MDKKNLFSIGEVANMFHISVSSLRHYEKIGLLTPEYISEESGYRYYGTAQFEILNTIRYLRVLDMPLEEIESFVKNRDISSMEEKLRHQREIVIRKQQELKRIEQKIVHRLNWLEDAQNEPLDRVTQVKLPAGRIVWMEDSLKIEDFLDMEAPIRRLDQSDAEAVVFLGKVGLGISRDHLLAGQTEKYDGVFLALDQEDIYSGNTSILPEMAGVRIRFRGSHAQAPAQYQILLEYIREHSLEIAGFSREVTLIDYGITNDTDKFVTEICIPIAEHD